MQPLYDDIQELRIRMVDECIHPYDMLIYNDGDDSITCKFCEKTMKPIEYIPEHMIASSLEQVDETNDV